MALSVDLKEFFGTVALQGVDSNDLETSILVETDGTLKTSLYGSDEASNLGSVRTDPNRILWTRPFESFVNLVGVAVPSAEGVLLDGSASLTAAGVYLVEFEVVNIDGTNAVSVDIGRDDAAGGGLAAAEYWMKSETVPAAGSSGWRGPYIITGDDDVRGVAGAANDAVIHFMVRRVDTGA